MATALKNRFSVLMAVMALMAVSAMTVLMETLDVSSLIDPDAMFSNANILLQAFGALVLLIVGFGLAKVVIRFVINMFSNFSL